MPPAGAKAPTEYLFAIVVGAIVVGLTPLIDPPTTRWIVLAVGVVMLLSSIAAALRPLRSR